MTAAKIEARLSPLVGLPLWAITRACTLQSFQFGPRKVVTQEHGKRAGTQKEVGSHALHVECAWRIHGPGSVIVASRDRYETVDGGTDWDRVGMNRCDVQVRDFLEASCPCTVLAVRADALGTLRIEFERGHVLDVFPDESGDDEQWRFFSPYGTEAHAVFSGGQLRDE